MDNDVIIIDDKIDEVEIIIKEFSKNKISIKYFNGDIEELPENPKFSPKFVFLDLYLEDGVRDAKTVFSRCIGNLEKLLYQGSEYILCIWTLNVAEYKSEPLLSQEKFNIVLETKNIKPIEIILLEDKKTSLDSKKLGNYTKNLIKDHSEIIFRIKARGKILELSLDIERELDKWIIKNIIQNQQEQFYSEVILNKNILDFMKKFKIFKEYYEYYKDKIPANLKLDDIEEHKVTGIRNAFAHQEIGEKILIGKTEYKLTHEQLTIFIKLLKGQKELIFKFN